MAPLTGRRLLGIYLDDHAALLVGGYELVRRALRGASEPELHRLLEALLPELRDDREAVARIAASVGHRPSRLKPRLAWAAEKAGRLKLNGAVTTRSPLSGLVELEAIAAVLGACRDRWRTLERVGPGEARDDAGRRASRVEGRLGPLEELRLRVADTVFGGAGRQS